MNQQQRGEELELRIVGAQVMGRSSNVDHACQPLQQQQRPASCNAFTSMATYPHSKADQLTVKTKIYQHHHHNNAR